MELFYRKSGSGAPLIIIHGLYGSSDNWLSIAKSFEQHFEVFLIDQRNHGRSPHSPEHNYALMTADLLEFVDKHRLDRASIVGHSMGGQTAMFFATTHPERVANLVVVDISPRPNDGSIAPQAFDHNKIIKAMLGVDFTAVKQRSDVEKQLAAHIHDERVRNFLLKNIRRADDGLYSWTLNIRALASNFNQLFTGLDASKFADGRGVTGFPVLFMRGALSNYITDNDIGTIKTVFPYADVVTIPKAGHWIQADQPQQFVKTLSDFLIHW